MGGQQRKLFAVARVEKQRPPAGRSLGKLFRLQIGSHKAGICGIEPGKTNGSLL